MAQIIRRMTRLCMFGAVALWSVDAVADFRMKTDCQKNRTDGRVIADLGGRSPDAVRFKGHRQLGAGLGGEGRGG